MTIVQEQLLSLLRAALWSKEPDSSLFKEVSWKNVIHLAEVETVKALLLDGISLLPKELMPDEDTIMDLAGRQNKIVQHNQIHRETIVQIDQALKANNIAAVFMKGQITALRYPKPLHRQSGRTRNCKYSTAAMAQACAQPHAQQLGRTATLRHGSVEWRHPCLMGFFPPADTSRTELYGHRQSILDSRRGLFLHARRRPPLVLQRRVSRWRKRQGLSRILCAHVSVGHLPADAPLPWQRHATRDLAFRRSRHSLL